MSVENKGIGRLYGGFEEVKMDIDLSRVDVTKQPSLTAAMLASVDAMMAVKYSWETPDGIEATIRELTEGYKERSRKSKANIVSLNRRSLRC